MRSSKNDTQKFFKEQSVFYLDTIQSIKDRKIHYIQTGVENAATLVFVHGSPGSWDAYKTYLSDPILLKQFRMIAIDRPGFGHSGFRKSMGLKDQAVILNTLLDKLDNGRHYTLIGHSYGGPLIVQMALEEPSLYENLAILAGALDPEAEKPEKWRYPFRAFPLKYLVPGALRPSNDELILLKTELKTMKADLPLLSQNVLLIHGTDDELVPYQNVPFMQKEFTSVKDLQLRTLEGQNHFFVWEKEAFVKESIVEWLDAMDKP